MFTGIVEELGEVIAVDRSGETSRFRIKAAGVTGELAVGDSVAVDGVCLTAVAVAEGEFAVEAVAETLSRTTLGERRPGDRVDLERPVPATGRLDGHIVQGHVDGVGTVEAVAAEGDSRRIRVQIGADHLRYIAEKGSVALDGVSLTVTAVDGAGFEVVLIPHTLDATVLGAKSPGDRVNLEVDVLAKYVERLMGATR